tara:strand:+ start:131 stop:346 length:216 start_codon:yes stop_codon:yes gene_type:complete
MGILSRINKFFSSLVSVDTNKVLSKDDIKQLAKKTKLELEKIGRKIGVELDRRFTKSKLIARIKKINSKSK